MPPVSHSYQWDSNHLHWSSIVNRGTFNLFHHSALTTARRKNTKQQNSQNIFPMKTGLIVAVQNVLNGFCAFHGDSSSV